MPRGFVKGTNVRTYVGELKPVEGVVQGDVLMGDDGNTRTVRAARHGPSRVYTVTYSSYLDVKNDRSFTCGDDTVLVLVPDGNREHNRVISATPDNQYPVEFVEPIVDGAGVITGVEYRRKVFGQAEEALSYVDKSLPNFLYEVSISRFLQYDVKTQGMFKLVRPLLPIRFVDAVTAIQNDTKAEVDVLKTFEVRSTDMPWLCGLYLVTGVGVDEKTFRFHLKELHTNVLIEVKRIFECLGSYYKLEIDEATGNYSVTFLGTDSRTDYFKKFMTSFGLYDAGSRRYTKDRLSKAVYLESFSRIRGPFLAGILDGSSGYGLSDINHGLECYVRGITHPSTRATIADLARSCSLSAVIDEQDGSITLAGGMLFRVPCVATIPKDFPGLVSLTSYPNPDGTSVLLGMPMPFTIREKGTEECYSFELQEQNKRCLLEEYTVVNV
ncbi:Homing endonuclease [Giardia muris]|uniref:Homing endonuclease n=1 Tax=Giardia muris TaxID=5742 RepID=A0A4Z1T1W3_GIAMU|nr:Homing endonuclease [Giardia muris]|eukprot:TNJ26967.1 Homing endonuclease [Giardia muris]